MFSWGGGVFYARSEREGVLRGFFVDLRITVGAEYDSMIIEKNFL